MVTARALDDCLKQPISSRAQEEVSINSLAIRAFSKNRRE
jgi:hypothetical protein